MTAPQGTEEWRRARAGKATASRIADVMARTRNGYGATRANYMAELMIERLTGRPVEGYVTEAMRWGTEHEAEARLTYAFMFDAEVAEVGFIPHPSIAGAGASPDGEVGRDGLVELKAPNTATHIETLLSGQIPDKYLKQMQFQMACAERRWCDFVSFDPRLPPAMQLWVKRVERDPVAIGEIEAEVKTFLAELAAKLAELANRYTEAA